MPMASRFLSSRLLSKPLAALTVSSAAYLCFKNKTYAIMRPLSAPKNDLPRFSVFLPWHMLLYRPFQTKERLFVQQLFEHLDMRETEDNLLLRLYLLQLNREDVKIYVDHKTLTIKDANGGRIFGIFGDRSRFTCTLELTEQYCKYPITAKMEKGMLEVVVPKMNNEEGMLKVVLHEGETIDVKVE